MSTMHVLIAVWALVTILFLILVFYRSRITKTETDWIPLSGDAKEEKAIEAQKVSEMKGRKLDRPIRFLGWLWVIMIFVVVGFWLYHGITTPPPMAK
jgi:amino acid transporter